MSLFFIIQNEVDEWTEVNRKLKNHGLHIIKLLHPSDVALMTGTFLDQK